MHTFKKGEKVAVINQTIGGRFMVEGTATVVRTIRDLDESYVVEFADGQRCQRFIDPAAQVDPAAFVETLNTPRAAHG